MSLCNTFCWKRGKRIQRRKVGENHLHRKCSLGEKNFLRVLFLQGHTLRKMGHKMTRDNYVFFHYISAALLCLRPLLGNCNQELSWIIKKSLSYYGGRTTIKTRISGYGVHGCIPKANRIVRACMISGGKPRQLVGISSADKSNLTDHANRKIKTMKTFWLYTFDAKDIEKLWRFSIPMIKAKRNLR